MRASEGGWHLGEVKQLAHFAPVPAVVEVVNQHDQLALHPLAGAVARLGELGWRRQGGDGGGGGGQSHGGGFIRGRGLGGLDIWFGLQGFSFLQEFHHFGAAVLQGGKRRGQ